MNNKKITIYDIAAETGFSVGTVNRALSGKPRISPATKKLILETAEKLGYKANSAAQGLRRSPIKIGAILFCPIEEYVDSIISGIQSSALDLEKYNVTVDIRKIPYTTGTQTLNTAEKQIEEFAGCGYNGIILFLSSMIDEMSGVTQLINKLSEKNIHFATVANDIPDCDRVIHVGIDAFTAGKMAAEILEMSCGGKQVALLVTSRTSPVNIEYIRGFFDYAQKGIFSDIKIYEHYDDCKQIVSSTARMLNENPDLKGVYMSTAGSVKACEYIRSVGRKDLSVITTDLLTSTPELLSDKTATATIFQNPYRQGRNVTRMIYNYITTGNNAGVHLIPPQVLLSSNIDIYLNNENM